MKPITQPKSLIEQTNATLEALEREIFGERREPRRMPKSGVRAGDIRPAYGTP